MNRNHDDGLLHHYHRYRCRASRASCRARSRLRSLVRRVLASCRAVLSRCRVFLASRPFDRAGDQARLRRQRLRRQRRRRFVLVPGSVKHRRRRRLPPLRSH